MSKTTVIIGLGVIARYHVLALRQAKQFCLKAVCDLRAEAAQDSLYYDLPYFRDYEELIDTIRPEIAIIATPPDTHYKIAAACVQRGVLPIVEKPLATMEEEGMHFFSEPLQGRYVPLCHTLYGEETLWFNKHLPLQDIRSIHMSLSDPYADENGHIEERYLSLGGSWLDSAPNALAVLLPIAPSLTDIEVTHLRDEHSGLPFASALKARYEQAAVRIEIDWHKGINHKQTDILADGKEICINHSQQTVTINGEQVFKAQGDRLTQQYANFYRLYPENLPSETKMRTMYQIIYSHL